MRRLRSESGFTLIEVTIAATLLVVGVLGVLSLVNGANRATARNKAREGGINLAREAIEARIAMIRITTSSSIRVKPAWSRVRARRDMLP